MKWMKSKWRLNKVMLIGHLGHQFLFFICSVIHHLWTRQLLVPVPPECWIFKMASLCYFLVSSYRSALFAHWKCNLGSISSFLICPSAAKHTLQRNMKENSRRGLKTNTKGSACLQEKAGVWHLQWRLQTADCWLLTADCWLLTADHRLQIVN